MCEKIHTYICVLYNYMYCICIYICVCRSYIVYARICYFTTTCHNVCYMYKMYQNVRYMSYYGIQCITNYRHLYASYGLHAFMGQWWFARGSLNTSSMIFEYRSNGPCIGNVVDDGF